MSGETGRILARLEEVRDMIREAEVGLRESKYYPPPETHHHLLEATANLVAAERKLGSVLDSLGSQEEVWDEAGHVDTKFG